MPTLIMGLVAVALLYFALQFVKSADPKALARVVRTGGGVLALAAAAFIGIRGQIAVAIPLGIFGAGLLGWAPMSASRIGRWGSRRSSGQKSRVQSAFLDMVLDHDSGELTGRIIAGAHAGRSLDEFDMPQLAALTTSFDSESAALLESYMDRRFPGWRQHAQRDGAGRQSSRAAATGKMSREEAYEILGVQPGASANEISRAHRSLMKKLHPDQGGSTYLAARVNEAKDTLLRTHRS